MIFNPKTDAANAPKPEDEEAMAALRAMGMHAEGPLSHRADGPPGVFYLWPEHVQAFAVFRGCATQWRTSMNGREGLDYAAVEIVMRDASGRRSGFRQKDARRIRQEIQVLEFAALDAWADQREGKK